MEDEEDAAALTPEETARQVLAVWERMPRREARQERPITSRGKGQDLTSARCHEVKNNSTVVALALPPFLH